MSPIDDLNVNGMMQDVLAQVEPGDVCLKSSEMWKNHGTHCSLVLTTVFESSVLDVAEFSSTRWQKQN